MHRDLVDPVAVGIAHKVLRRVPSVEAAHEVDRRGSAFAGIVQECDGNGSRRALLSDLRLAGDLNVRRRLCPDDVVGIVPDSCKTIFGDQDVDFPPSDIGFAGRSFYFSGDDFLAKNPQIRDQLLSGCADLRRLFLPMMAGEERQRVEAGKPPFKALQRVAIFSERRRSRNE
jgi:hypothetical protein